MSIRVTVLYIVAAGLSIYAWKDWFKSLCGLILMAAIITHEDVPKTMFGIQGFNTWNILFLVVFLAWLVSLNREGIVWDIPRHISVLLILYLGVILVGFLRAVFDRSYIGDYPLKHLISEELINTVKWALPGLLFFGGCRTRRRVIIFIVCVLSVYLLVSIQVIRFMPASAAIRDFETMTRLRVRLGRYIGYSACDISAMLSGASWATLAIIPLIRKRVYWIPILAVAGIITFGQALTGGRAGFLAWGATGFILCLLKWRKYLILAPVIVMLLPIVFPAATSRMLSGFGENNIGGQSFVDDVTVTSGRTLIWPVVIEKISESPIVGYGRLGFRRTGLAYQLEQKGLPFGHPHNVYLETLLDNGILGSLPIILFWGITILYSIRLFRNNNHLCSAVGGVTLSLTLAQLFAGIGAQHYYPRISTLGMWAATFMMFRVYVEEKHPRIITPAEFQWEDTSTTKVLLPSAYYQHCLK